MPESVKTNQSNEVRGVISHMLSDMAIVDEKTIIGLVQ